jgi:hypothetical protein
MIQQYVNLGINGLIYMIKCRGVFVSSDQSKGRSRMAKFLLLYHGGAGMPQTEAESAKILKSWEVWYTALGKAVVDPGNPFTPAAKKVASNGAVSNGPAGTMATGYTILEAESLDKAARLAQGCPVLVGGGEISVFETFNVM